MNNLSTKCVNKMMGKGKSPDGKDMNPRKQTLSFLKQFARVYHVEPTMRQDFCGFVIN